MVMQEFPPIPDKEFFTIGEVSVIVQVAPYVLRYWESEFKLLRPARRTSGQRKYVRKDIETIFLVKDLLYNKRFTIAGAKKHLLGDRRRKEEQPQQLNCDIAPTAPAADPRVVEEVCRELEDIVNQLSR